MALFHRFIIALPLALSIVGFVLTTLALFSGHNDGFLEDYAIARVNVSMIGRDVITSLVDSSDDQQDDNDDDDSGFFDAVRNKWDEATDKVIEEINDIIGDTAEDIAEAIGIADWYSIHVMNACEGDFKPNATVKGAGFNGTNCTDSSPAYRLNLTAVLDRDLSVGPFDINLADIGWSDDIQDKLDILNDALLGLFVLYVLGMAFCGIAIIGCVAAFVFPDRKSISIVNFVVSILAAACLIIASILVTVAATKGVNEINDVAKDIGVHVVRGTKFLIITWVAGSVMLSAMVFWTVRFFMLRKQQKTYLHSEKRYSRS